MLGQVTRVCPLVYDTCNKYIQTSQRWINVGSVFFDFNIHLNVESGPSLSLMFIISLGREFNADQKCLCDPGSKMKSCSVSGGQSRHFVQLNSTQLPFPYNIHN